MPRAARLRGAVLSVAWAVLATTADSAEIAGDLYQSTVFTTGQGEETRGSALGRALEAVLVKVSGDPRLASDARVETIGATAADYVDSFSYRDRMAGIPVHDEQGSRDRPYDLTVVFRPDGIDEALDALGSAPWSGPRPELLVLVAVRNGSTEFILAVDGAKGRDMREAMAAAAEQFGMQTTLPKEAALAEAGIAGRGGADLAPAALDALAIDSGADIPLSGTLTWSDADLGWDAAWRMTADGIPYRWQAHRVSFDQAFRTAVGGAAQILSGHGAPN